MDLAEWEVVRAARFREDPLWRMRAYRLAAYAADVAWSDVRALQARRPAELIASQLYRAVGSIGANIAEGYSRSSGRDRVRLYEYALGSARECRHWYDLSEPVLGAETVARRRETMNRICHLLLVTLPDERERTINRRQR